VSSWRPIRELNRTDADVNLLFLRQAPGMQYAKPVTDPWFEAKSPKAIEYEDQPGVFKNMTAYFTDILVSTVGCTVQYQWCDPNTGPDMACTDLTKTRDSLSQGDKLFKREKQLITLARLFKQLATTNSFNSIVFSLAGSALLANKHGNYQLAAPREDQWIRELSHMFGTLMTNMQIRNYRYTGGYQSTLDINPVIKAPLANETWMCDAQMVRREDYQSLNVLGIGLICGIGGLIILINLTLDFFVGWYQKRYNKRAHATHEWEMLQAETLQRQLYKSHGVDLQEGNVSMASILQQLIPRYNGETMATLVEREAQVEKALKSMSSQSTLAAKDGSARFQVRRMSTDMTIQASPLSQSSFV
jgi:hypothetical protein